MDRYRRRDSDQSARPVTVRVSSRAAVLALVAFLLVFAVALGSSRSLAAPGPRGPARSAPDIAGDLALALAVLVAMVLAGLGYALWSGRRRRRDDEQERIEQLPVPWWQRSLVLVAALLFGAGAVTAAAVTMSRVGSSAGARGPGLGATGSPAASPPGAPMPASPAGGGPVHWWFWASLVVAVVVVAAAGLAFVVWRDRGRGAAAGTLRRAPRPLPEMIEESVAEIERESDPRRAVIRAYVGMEQALARHGVGRHAFEAPQEYLARALGVIRVSGQSGERLTGLFQRARFSEHPVSGTMKQEAIAALAAIRAELMEHAR